MVVVVVVVDNSCRQQNLSSTTRIIYKPLTSKLRYQQPIPTTNSYLPRGKKMTKQQRSRFNFLLFHPTDASFSTTVSVIYDLRQFQWQDQNVFHLWFTVPEEDDENGDLVYYQRDPYHSPACLISSNDVEEEDDVNAGDNAKYSSVNLTGECMYESTEYSAVANHSFRRPARVLR